MNGAKATKCFNNICLLAQSCKHKEERRHKTANTKKAAQNCEHKEERRHKTANTKKKEDTKLQTQRKKKAQNYLQITQVKNLSHSKHEEYQ